jgi:hypothetical protein
VIRSGPAGTRTRVTRVQTERSSAELRAQNTTTAEWSRRGLNPGPLGCEPSALPLSYDPMNESCRRDSNPHGPEWRSGASPLGHGSRNVGTASALGRDRTDDPRFTKPVLFQLSYKGMAGRQGVEPCPPGFGVRAAPGARPVKVKKKCRPLESNQVLLLFRQAREPSTPGRQSLLRALLQGIEPCSRGRRPRRDPIASKSKEVGWRDSNPLEPGSRPGDSPFVISQHQSGYLESNQERSRIRRESYHWTIPRWCYESG